jgi:ankyrin repeat protein
LACKGYLPEKIVLKLITVFQNAIKAVDFEGRYPLHHACIFNQSSKVVSKLITEFPQSVKSKDGLGKYPLQYACEFAQSESVVSKLIHEFPQAASEREDPCHTTLEFACGKKYSDRVILALIDLNLMATYIGPYSRIDKERTLLAIAKKQGHSTTILKVLAELMDMSYENLKNRVGIPKIVTLHGLDYLRRQDIYQWALDYSPSMIGRKFVIHQSSMSKRKASTYMNT